MKRLDRKQWFGGRRRRAAKAQRRGLAVEGLEVRRLLVGDVAVIGDSDHDGMFDTGDFVQVFQEGKFETGEEATFDQGDWNSDGYFDSGDIVFAFQNGSYGVAQPLAADDGSEGETDELPVDELPDENGGDNEDGEETDEGPRHHRWFGFHRSGNREDRRGSMVDNIIAKLNDGLESGELPGDLTAEAAEGIIAQLEAAKESGDFSGLRDIIGPLLKGRADHDGEGHADRASGYIQNVIDKLNEGIESGELPGDLTPEDAQGIIDQLTAAQESGDYTGLRDVLSQLKEDPHADRLTGHIESFLIRVQESIDSGDLPAETQDLLDAAKSLLESGDLDAARQQLRDIWMASQEDKHEDPGEPTDDNGEGGEPVGLAGIGGAIRGAIQRFQARRGR